MRRLVVIGLVGMTLAACGSTKLLGSRTPPDETTVIDGPSLAVPPDFNLRPPTDGDDYAARLSAQKTAEAQSLIAGTPVSGTQAVTGANDQWLLQQAGGQADSDIRTKLDADAAPKPDEKKSFWQRLMGKDE